MTDEMNNKHTQTLDPADWSFVQNQSSTPQQKNGHDSGVFSLMYADYLADDLPLNFGQSDMPLFRMKIAASILRKRIK